MIVARSSEPAPSRPTPWLIVGVVWLTLAVAFGVFFSFSIFFVALIEEFRWSRALTAAAFSVSTIVQGLLAPVTGVVVDRFGPRGAILAGVVVLGAAPLLASTIQSLWQLYLYTGVLGAVGLALVGWVPMSVLLARWVTERRGRITGIAFSGMGIGVFVVGPVAQSLIVAFGWRVASALLGAGVIALLLPVAWWGAREPGRGVPRATSHDGPGEGRSGESDAGPRSVPRPAGDRRDPTLADALRSRAFWALFSAYFLTPLAVFPVLTHQVAFAVDVGFPRLFVASIFGLVGLMSSVGRVIFGVIADKVGAAPAATISFGCTAGGALALVALELWPGAGWLFAYALLFGLGFGARGPIITTIATDLFGGRRFGVIYGVLSLANGMGAAIGPWFGGAVHDLTGSYRLAFLSSVGFSALASGCFFIARRRAP